MHTSLITATAAAAFAATLAPASAAVITFAGTEGNVTQWRTTTVAKTLDADGDNVYGTAGYVGYAMQTTAGTFPGSAPGANPLTFSSANFATLRSDPSFLTLANNGGNQVAYGFNYVQVDDPRVTPGPTVADIQSGFGLNNGTRTGPLVNLTLGSTFPTSGARVGVIVDDMATSNDRLSNITLAQTAGSGSGSATVALSNTGGNFSFFFFDVTGSPGDTLTLSLAKTAGIGNNNVLAYGLSFDALPTAVVPEPASAAVAVAGLGLVGLRRRTRRA